MDAGSNGAITRAKPGADLAAVLQRRIVERHARIGVIGLGYVGLPLGLSFAESGFAVVGFDVDAERIAALNAGKSHISDISSVELASYMNHGLFRATADMSELGTMDAISICVPTPLSKTRDPDISHVAAATEQVARYLRPGQLIILESTTYPGTTREVILPQLEATGLRAGEDFFLAFSPERVDPGNAHYGIRNTPKVIGGVEERSTKLATLLYAQTIDTVVPVSSPEVAEMVKLHENTFRAVNIALANETALMCDRLGLDVWEVIDAAATKPFGFMSFYPGPGIGGHCIPLDPFYLSWKMKTLNYRTRFIELAAEVNAEMPHHVVDKIAAGLNEAERSVKGSNILVLGVAYKPHISDARESPALDIIGLLLQRGAHVTYSDPYVPQVRVLDTELQSVPLTEEHLSTADCVVVVTNHRDFDYAEIQRHACLIVDTRNALSAKAVHGASLTGL